MGEKSKKSKKLKMANMRIQLQANELFDKGEFQKALEKVSLRIEGDLTFTRKLT